MSVKVMTAVWEHGPKDSTQRFVLLALADHASDDGGNAYPSIETIATKCAMSERTVVRAINALIADGYLIRQRRQSTSNLYQIVLSMLVSDNLSLSNVTECHPVSDTVSLSNVTDCHLRGDTVSPKPSSNHPINHQGEPSGARTKLHPATARVMAASPPLPPVVHFGSTDRTPGGKGFSSPPEPDPVKPEPPAIDPAIGEMANALTKVTGVSARLNWHDPKDRTGVGDLAADLVQAGFAAAQVLIAYSRQPTAGAWHWYAAHWKGRKGDAPTLKDIRETIAGATARAAPAKKPSPIDRALAMFGNPPADPTTA